MLDFEKKVLIFKFNGEEQELEYPTVKMINEFRKQLKKQDNDEVDLTIDFICKLGSKKEIIESLRVSQLNKLVEELTQELSDSKKN